jgi:hypothetical protein
MKKNLLMLCLVAIFTSCKQDFYVFDIGLYQAYQNETGKEVPEIQTALQNYQEEKKQSYPEFKPFIFPDKIAKNLYNPAVPAPCFCPAPIMPRSQYNLKNVRFFTYAASPQDIEAKIVSDGQEVATLKTGKMDEQSNLIPLLVEDIGNLEEYQDLTLIINTQTLDKGEIQLLLDIYKNVIKY